MKTKGRILVVEDELDSLKFTAKILRNSGYEVVEADSIDLANQIITSSLITGVMFNLILLDLQMQLLPQTKLWSGEEFGRRVIEIIGNVNVVVITGNADLAARLTYKPDDAIIKPVNINTLLDSCKKLMKPERRRANPPDVMLNLWLSTQYFQGFESLTFHSRRTDRTRPGEESEKITSRCVLDGAFINTVIYRKKKGVVNISLSSLLGCPADCVNCKNPRNRRNRYGHKVKFIRPLTEGEIIGQAYVALNSPKVKNFLKKGGKTKLIFNLASEGDGLVWNLDNCMKTFIQLSKITALDISFKITSVGSESALLEYIRKYINLPRVTHHRSIDSLLPETRFRLKPGTIKEPLTRIRNCDEIIAQMTNQPVTISWVVMKGVNDSIEDARMIADFYGNRFLPDGRPIFRIKLMALVPGSLDHANGFDEAKGTTMEDVKRFRGYLKKEGVKDVRIRDIIGMLINAGCGGCIVEWLEDADKMK
ncbi:MAG: putative dual-specificity RNA methyltransferase RlmN [Parcubacteria group bacterium GW2011_GWE2_39_37]|uniref:Putative dual-specificity RNA methyltransferase RlmN n=1 Tax=Candidatus Falkowbacteria bacterium GW2011_GWF2_39_8 TaxID=1618642 RepID=A0A0G0PXL5_9BACT|nr:MAG: putative dual-specificity RNA methyltransferase RlmN [Parcubacteria group bacterium GW2011_GWE2_39_37]KKR32633.1 MAG: putative dual-specificity RNA methyltransferase RlmN [Candidatus Falkowbacteria bacterium GW2011_GWF2_39_8]